MSRNNPAENPVVPSIVAGGLFAPQHQLVSISSSLALTSASSDAAVTNTHCTITTLALYNKIGSGAEASVYRSKGIFVANGQEIKLSVAVKYMPLSRSLERVNNDSENDDDAAERSERNNVPFFLPAPITTATQNPKPISAVPSSVELSQGQSLNDGQQNEETEPLFCMIPFANEYLRSSLDIHQVVNHGNKNIPSAFKGVLNVFCVLEIPRNNPHDLPSGVFCVLPECLAILNQVIPRIVALRDSNPSLYRHVMFELLSSMVMSLKTLGEKGVIHRDVKPANAGFREYEIHRDGSIIKKIGLAVFDFGMAVRTRNQIEQRRGENFAGTPFYMPPECFDEDCKQIDSRIDIWAFGQIVRELCGEKPIYRETIQNLDSLNIQQFGLSVKEIMHQLSQNEPSAELPSLDPFDTSVEQIKRGMCEMRLEKRMNLERLKESVEALRMCLPEVENSDEQVYQFLSEACQSVKAETVAQKKAEETVSRVIEHVQSFEVSHY